MSWSWEAAPSLECAMFGSYAAPASNRSATSGVVYRQEHQPSEIAGIKGFNYVPSWAVNDIDMWRDYNAPIVERDMAIAATVGFNFARVFLNYVVWSAQRSTFLKNLNHFVKTAHANGIATMPVALDLCWFGCRTPPNFNVSATGKCWYPSPAFNHADNRTWWSNEGAAYLDALTGSEGLPAGTPGLLLWDVVNEPETGGATNLPGEPAGPRWTFVKWAVKYMQSVTKTPTTVGVAEVGSLATVGSAVDILSFHSYHNTWEDGLLATQSALGFAAQFNKPVFNSETGCIARANAFDQTVEMAVSNGIGYVLWELMISDCLECIDTRRWKHGLMFTDGTTRDPSAVAAVRGIYLNRGEAVSLAVPRADVEGISDRIGNDIVTWINQGSAASFAKGVQILDAAANVLESSRVSPSALPLSGLVRVLGDQGETVKGARANLTAALSAQAPVLAATKNGGEQVPGTCTFSRSAGPDNRQCTTANGCILKSNADVAFFQYTPKSTTTGHSCWTEVGGCPIIETNGTLHYCSIKSNPKQVHPTIQFQVGGGGLSQIISKVSRIDVVYKASTDCGIFNITNQYGSSQTIDTYAPATNWEATATIAKDVDLTVVNMFQITVTNASNPNSTDQWIQIVGLHIWL